MRPQKSKRFRDNNNNSHNSNTHIQNRWNGYYLEDIDCLHCIHWRGKRKGCPFRTCAFESEKLDATKNGRIKRRGGGEILVM